MTRARARDLFDLDFLLKKKVYSEEQLIAKKMGYYNKEFSISKIIQKIKSLDKRWEKELSGFTSETPGFQKTSKEVIEYLKKYYNKR